MNLSSAELKKFARIALKGKYGVLIGTYLIFQVIVFAVSVITNVLFRYNASVTSLVIYISIQFVLSFIWVIFSVGFIYQSMKVCRGEPISIADLFYAFTHNPDRYIIISLLEILIVLVLFAPSIALFTIASLSGVYVSTALIVVGGIFTLIGYVFIFIIVLAFSLSFYLIIDNPSMSAIDSLKTSWHLMKGKKGRLFYISLSFIGLTLLGILSFGVGLLWVVPYMNVTTAYFYFDVIGALNPPVAPVAPIEPAVSTFVEPTITTTPPEAPHNEQQ